MSAKRIHEKDVVGTQVVDFEERIDVRRLRLERIGRIQAELGRAGLGGLLLFDPINVRYATGTRNFETFFLHLKGRHALIPQEGKPILFMPSVTETPVLGEDVIGRPVPNMDSWRTGSYVVEATKRWAVEMRGVLSELNIAGEPLAMDRSDILTIHSLEEQGVSLEDGLMPMNLARMIKTEDELVLIKQACAIGDVALAKVQEAIEPGVTENELYSVLASTNLKFGGERTDSKLLCAGGNTNPWLKREASDRLVLPGNLVTIDTDMAGPLGYFADISRTYLCGDAKPNEEQSDAYKRAYQFLQDCLPLYRAGASFQEISEKTPKMPEEYKANRYTILAHGDGMSDEYPAIFFPDGSDTGFGNYPGVLEENMVISVESSWGRENGLEQVKLEEQVIITRNGPEVISQAPFDWRFLG